MKKKNLKDYLKESSYMIPVKNKYAEGKNLGPLEKYDPNNINHDDPKKYQYYHTGGTVFNHMIETLKQMKADKPLEMICSMLHDLGKSVTFSDTTPGKTYTYYGHDKEGVKLVKTIADRLKMSNKERDALLFTVANHMKFIKLSDMKPSKVFKIVSDDNWDALVAVARADEFSRGETFMSKKDFEKSLEAAIKIKKKWGNKGVHKRMQLVDGNHVMELLDIGPGPKVGEVIKKTTEWILDTGNDNQQEIDDYIRRNWS